MWCVCCVLMVNYSCNMTMKGASLEIRTQKQAFEKLIHRSVCWWVQSVQNQRVLISWTCRTKSTHILLNCCWNCCDSLQQSVLFIQCSEHWRAELGRWSIYQRLKSWGHTGYCKGNFEINLIPISNKLKDFTNQWNILIVMSAFHSLLWRSNLICYSHCYLFKSAREMKWK